VGAAAILMVFLVTFSERKKALAPEGELAPQTMP
jgi:hypothetical protein